MSFKKSESMLEWDSRVKHEHDRLCERHQKEEADYAKTTWNKNR